MGRLFINFKGACTFVVVLLTVVAMVLYTASQTSGSFSKLSTVKYIIGSSKIDGVENKFTSADEQNYDKEGDADGNESESEEKMLATSPAEAPTIGSTRPKEQPTVIQRVTYCNDHDSFADFCFSHRKSTPLTSEPGSAKYDAISEIYQVPILVIGSINDIALSQCLQSLYRQPGLNKSMVFVSYSTMFGPDYTTFIQLFGFKNIIIQPFRTYAEFITASLKHFWEMNTNAQYAIIIDDEVMTKPGYLWYMGHALKAMKADDTIGAASAWNPQGFEDLSANLSAVFPVSHFPSQSFLISKEFYESEIKGKEKECCKHKSILQWFQSGTSRTYRYIVPEVSRVDYFSPTAYSAEKFPLSKLAMSKPRISSSASFAEPPLDWEFVLNFDNRMTRTLQNAFYLGNEVAMCNGDTNSNSFVKQLSPTLNSDRANVVVYQQRDDADHSVLKKMYQCFGLMYQEGYPAYGMYKGVTSMTVNNRRVILVGSSSDFYKKTIQPLSSPVYVAH